ncbi:MAG TPA: MarR family transcriptional regulator [Thermoanaerobaculia bacterium]|nr:MarR family transcriptional regulator [Thermoanaerobaculia bacterium]
MITVDQLPDSRRAILLALKRQGPATIAQLADELQLTGEAVRQQLLQLQREGWVEARIARSPERGRTGRPATNYSLTDAGDHLFPKHYDELNVAMFDAIADELGADALKKILARLADAKVSLNEGPLRGMTLAQRVQALKDWYLKDDPHMEVEQVEDGFRLIERNCPYINTAMNKPSLCSVSVNALSKLLGVRVEREEKFQNGNGRCIFRVYANEPIDPNNFDFELEKER